MKKLFSNKKAIIIFITPALLLFCFVLLFPMIQMFYYSATEYDGLSAPRFVGFKNYINLFTDDPDMLTSIKNSVFFMIFSAVTQQVIGLMIAAILMNVKRGRDFFKNIYYLPAVLSSGALGFMWAFFFSPRMGLNQILALFSIHNPPLWLMDTNGFIILPMWVIAFVALWQYMGTTMMLYMAQISGISRELFEASYIDGAGRFQSFWRITLPLVRPMVATSLSLNCIGAIKFFDLIYNMTGGTAGPNYRTSVLAFWLYWKGFQHWRLGYSCAIAVVLLAMSLLVTFIINKAVKIEDYA